MSFKGQWSRNEISWNANEMKWMGQRLLYE